jgi:cytochrome c biogenesis protein CcmG, thiol:disulfide interchange protein DsbE
MDRMESHQYESPPGQGKTRKSKLVLTILLSAVLLLLGILAQPLLAEKPGPLLPGSAAPDFTLTGYDGASYTLSSLRGNVVVINFWASWCKPCAEEAALLEAVYREYREEQIVFIGIAYSDRGADALAFLETHQISYLNGPDEENSMSAMYGVRGVPETFIIAPDGSLAAVRIGPFTEKAELEAMILNAR